MEKLDESICFSGIVLNFLLNGALEGFFRSSCGLRQGNPFSHFLFILVFEALIRLFLKAEKVGLMEGWQVSPRGPKVSILQFVDDTLLFLKAEEEKVRVL